MTSGRHYTLFLRDILNARDECLGFVEGMTFDEFRQDRKTMLAVEREIEIIGEAAGKIPSILREASPEIDWQEMLAMRIRLAHIYFDVNPEYVWSTVQDDLPPLRQSIQRLLNEYRG